MSGGSNEDDAESSTLADFFVVGPGSFARSGQFAAVLTAMASGERPLVRELVVVLPPGVSEREVGDAVRDAFRTQRVELFGHEAVAHDGDGLPSSVRFEASGSFNATTDTSVPPIWLLSFLRAWAARSPVIDACFEANAAVRAGRGPTPSADLAMTVYGDPLMGRSSSRRKEGRD